jgi:pimeloyl-ACP methyl ester carboxylesterase
LDDDKPLKMPIIKIQKKNISFTDEGRGKAIVLLHGFTESMKIWTGFAAKLAKKYRVITIDLPGHGKSACIGKVHTMEMMADFVYDLLKKLKVGKFILVGHSMGGYVALSFADKYPGMLRGICLFHSHCYADTIAEQENRNRTIALVNADKFSYVAQFIPSLFPVEVHKKFAPQIERMIQRASKMDKEGVVAALEGMKLRKDQTGLLKNMKLPVLFILGQKDSRTPLARLWEMISLPSHSETLLLRECGHMGYIEAPELTYSSLLGFIRNHL